MINFPAAITKHLELIRMHRSSNEHEIKLVLDRFTGDDRLLFQKLDELETAYGERDWQELFKRRGIR